MKSKQDYRISIYDRIMTGGEADQITIKPFSKESTYRHISNLFLDEASTKDKQQTNVITM